MKQNSNFIRPSANIAYGIHNSYGVKLLTTLHLSLTSFTYIILSMVLKDAATPIFGHKKVFSR